MVGMVRLRYRYGIALVEPEASDEAMPDLEIIEVEIESVCKTMYQ